MTLRKQIKQNGRQCLHDNWGKAIAIALLGFAIYLLFTMIEIIISMLLGVPFYLDSGTPGVYWDNIPNTSIVSITLTLIMSVGFFVILTPLKFGIHQWYYQLSEGESEDILSIFSWFSGRKLFFRALVLQLNIMVRILFWAVVYFILPITILFASIWYSKNGPAQSSYLLGTTGIVFGIMLMGLFAIFFGITIQKFFLARYYLLTEDIGVLASIKQSRRATKGRREQILIYHLSYAVWFLSCFLVLPALYVFPYYEMSSLIYARFLMESYSRSTMLVPTQQNTEMDTGATQVFETPDLSKKQQGTV